MEVSGQLHLSPPLCPLVNKRNSLGGKLAALQIRSERCGEDRKVLPLPGIESDSSVAQPVTDFSYRARSPDKII
jgi:hypothetical protein